MFVRSSWFAVSLLILGSLSQAVLADAVADDPCVLSGPRYYAQGATIHCVGTMTIKSDARLSAPAGSMNYLQADDEIVFEKGSELNFENSYLTIEALNASGTLDVRSSFIQLTYAATSDYDQSFGLNADGAVAMTLKSLPFDLAKDPHTHIYR